MELKINEIWKSIEEFEGKYEVSDLGNVRSLNYNNTTGKIRNLKPSISNSGYLRVQLSKGKKSHPNSIHILVVRAFLNHISNGHEKVVNHINKNKKDNRLINLEIVSQRENTSTRENCTSSYVGVSLTRNNTWLSSIYIKDKQVHLGKFKTEIEASLQYQKALKAFLDGKEIPIVKYSFSSKYKGITLHKYPDQWRAFVKFEGKHKYLGVFLTEEKAYKALNYFKKVNNL